MLFCLPYFIVGICYITNNLQKIWDVPKFYVKQQITELSISRIYKTKAHKTNIYISYSKHMDSNDTLFLEKKIHQIINLSFYLVMLLIHNYYTIRGWGLINNGF